MVWGNQVWLTTGTPDGKELSVLCLDRESGKVEHDLKLYPGVGHGFLNDHDPAELPLWVKAVAKLAAASHDEASARDARRRITAFFDAHLKC